ncbi:MAG TPA: hypothetical protein EYG68_06250 [Leucothrix mucor]|nr:hypothetical protein [Leucothrix mucor]
MPNKNLLTIISVIALTALAFIGYQVQSSFISPQGVPRATMQDDCDLHQSNCTALFSDGGKAKLSINPKEIPLLKPLQVELQLEGIQATDVQLNIIGLNMDMGINRNSLRGTTDAEKTIFTGVIILPVCSNQRMEWEAQARITTIENKVIIAAFQFYTDNK